MNTPKINPAAMLRMILISFSFLVAGSSSSHSQARGGASAVLVWEVRNNWYFLDDIVAADGDSLAALGLVEPAPGDLPDLIISKYGVAGKAYWTVHAPNEVKWLGSGRMAVADSGSIVVLYRSDRETNIDFGTLKYDASGNLLWSAYYDDGPDSGVDQPKDLALDEAGNVYVLALSTTQNSLQRSAVLVKYNAQGQELWRRQDNLGTKCSCVAIPRTYSNALPTVD